MIASDATRIDAPAARPRGRRSPAPAVTAAAAPASAPASAAPARASAATPASPDGAIAGAIPTAFDTTTPPASLVPGGDVRVLRRLRRIVRRRVRLDLSLLAGDRGAASVTDGDLWVLVETITPRDPHTLAWTADLPVALVVLHDGCGARVLGGGGLSGRIELPSILCPRAFLAFCYDGEPAGAAR
jgi:hypothetical protein